MGWNRIAIAMKKRSLDIVSVKNEEAVSQSGKLDKTTNYTQAVRLLNIVH